MLYTVKLNSFNTDEIIMIDLCMKLLNFDASQAYDCIDNMPSVLAEGIDMDKVKEIRTAFESEGAILDVTPINDEQAYKASNDKKEANNKESLSKNNKLASMTSGSLNSSDLEILNLKYNPYENVNNNDDILKNNDDSLDSNKIEDRRNGVTYGRRSTDINPMSNNYGRRSTDVNPMRYNDDSSFSPYLNSSSDLKRNKTKSVYTNDLENNKSQSVYTSGLDNNKSQSVHTSGLDNNKSQSVYTNGLDNNKSQSVYTSGLGNNKSQSVYTSELDNNKSQSVYTGGLDNNKSQSTYIENPFSAYTNGQSPYTEGLNASEFTYKSPYLNNDDAKAEMGEEEDFGFEISEPKENLDDKNNELKSSNVYNMLNSDAEQLAESEKNIEPPKIPYDNNMMNFTHQQDVGEISKEDNLFSLSGIRRDKSKANKGSLPYEKDQITCPKCGSAFVSTKRGQGIFGTSKVKYICEACKNKF